MANAYYPSQSVRINCAFAVSGVATDPTTVTLTVEDPLGARTVYTYAGATVIKDAAGSYHVELIPVVEGMWSYGWVGTGAAQASSEAFFVILRGAP